MLLPPLTTTEELLTDPSLGKEDGRAVRCKGNDFLLVEQLLRIFDAKEQKHSYTMG